MFSTRQMSSKPFTSRPDHHHHILNPLTNICMATRPTPNEHCSAPYWHSDRPHTRPSRREVPLRSRTYDRDPYPRTTRSNHHHRHQPYHPLRSYQIPSADQHYPKPQPLVCQTGETDNFINTFLLQHIPDTARPSSASSSSSCMALTPTSSQMDAHSHLPAIHALDEPFLFIDEFQSSWGVLDSPHDFMSLPDWRYAAAVNAPPINNYPDQGRSSLSHCMPYSQSQPQSQSHSSRALDPDGASSEAIDISLDECDYDHNDDFPSASLYDNTSTLHDQEFHQQQQQYLYHQQTMHNYTPSPPEPPSVSLSPPYDTHQRFSSAKHAQTCNTPSPSLPMYQPQPVRPILLGPLSTLSSLASTADSISITPLRPPSHATVPITQGGSGDGHPPKPHLETRPKTRDVHSAAKIHLLSPFSLLCQPVSDSVRYQIEPVDTMNVHEPHPRTQIMGGDTISPHVRHGTSGRMLCGCSCSGGIHSSFLTDPKAW